MCLREDDDANLREAQQALVHNLQETKQPVRQVPCMHKSTMRASVREEQTPSGMFRGQVCCSASHANMTIVDATHIIPCCAVPQQEDLYCIRPSTQESMQPASHFCMEYCTLLWETLCSTGERKCLT